MATKITDLTPPDFFLWGYVKDKVYAKNPSTINELKNGIVEVIQQIPREMCETVRRSVEGRLRQCVKAKGSHVN
jgi:hypothetical protein